MYATGYRAITVSGGPFQAASPSRRSSHVVVPQPRPSKLVWFGLFRVRSPLLAESRLISVPAGTEMFQFPALASFRMTRLASGRVSPFGHPGITARVQLPRAYRSLPRPSSPLDAKASAVCLIAFDLMFSWPPGSCDRIGRPVLIPHTRPSPKARTHHPSSIVKEHGGPRRVRHTAVMQVRTRESAGDFRGLSSAAHPCGISPALLVAPERR